MADRTLFSPTLARLLQRRSLALAICVAAGAQALLVRLGLPAWPCPFAHAFGVACPGCGLSRATLALVGGDWRAALVIHAYAPLLLVALLLFVGASLLPARPRAALVNCVAAVERRTGLTAVLTVGLIAYWLARLLFAPEAMLRLARG